MINGICIDNYNGILRFIGIDSADGTSKVNGASTHMEIDLYNRGIYGGYYFDGVSAYADKLHYGRNITIGSQTQYFDGSSDISFDISHIYGNVICCQYNYTLTGLSGNSDINVTVDPVITEGIPLKGVQLGILLSYTPSLSWDTQLLVKSIDGSGNISIRTIGETTQDYTINILCIVDVYKAYS